MTHHRPPWPINDLGLSVTGQILIAFKIIAIILICSNFAIAQEDIENYESSPDVLREQVDAFSRTFLEKDDAQPASLRSDIADQLKGTFLNSSLKLKPRMFYMDRPNPTSPNKVAWALGGSSEFQSGKFYDVVSVGGEVFTSQRLYGPEDGSGTLLLKPDQVGYTVLGTAYGKAEYEGQKLTLYRQRIDLPYINSQDSRMTPNTFEGYMLSGEIPAEKPIKYVAGYISKMKKRNSTTFLPMSSIAGATGTNDGTTAFGAGWVDKKVTAGAINYNTADALNIFYSEANYTLGDDTRSVKLSAQYSEQRTLGGGAINNGENYSANMWGLQTAITLGNFAIKPALTVDDKGGDMLTPFGNYAGYNSSIVQDFNRAGEVAWRLGAAYDFKGVGIPNLTGYINYISGTHAVDPDTKESVFDQEEIDTNVDYRFKEGTLKGFWIRFRQATVLQEGVGNTFDYRIILNYEFSVFDNQVK